MFSPGGHAGICRRPAAVAKRPIPGIVQLHLPKRSYSVAMSTLLKSRP